MKQKKKSTASISRPADQSYTVFIICCDERLAKTIWAEVRFLYGGCHLQPVLSRSEFEYWQACFPEARRVFVYLHTEWAKAGEFGGLKLVYDILQHHKETEVMRREHSDEPIAGAIQLNVIGFCNATYIAQQQHRIPGHCSSIPHYFGCETLTMLQEEKLIDTRDPMDFADRRNSCLDLKVALAVLVHDIQGRGKKKNLKDTLHYISRLSAYEAVMNPEQCEAFKALQNLRQQETAPSAQAFHKALDFFSGLEGGAFTAADKFPRLKEPPHLRAAILEDNGTDMGMLKKAFRRWFLISDEHCLASGYNLDQFVAKLHEARVAVVFIDMVQKDAEGTLSPPQGPTLLRRLRAEGFVVRIVSRLGLEEIVERLASYGLEIVAHHIFPKSNGGFALSEEGLRQRLEGIIKEAIENDGVKAALFSNELPTGYNALTSQLEFKKKETTSLNDCYRQLQQSDHIRFKRMISSLLGNARSFKDSKGNGYRPKFARTALSEFAKNHTSLEALQDTLQLRMLFLEEARTSEGKEIVYYRREVVKGQTELVSTHFNSSFSTPFLSFHTAIAGTSTQTINERLKILTKRLGLTIAQDSKILSTTSGGKISHVLNVPDKDLYPHERAVRKFGLEVVSAYLAKTGEKSTSQ